MLTQFTIENVTVDTFCIKNIFTSGVVAENNRQLTTIPIYKFFFISFLISIPPL